MYWLLETFAFGKFLSAAFSIFSIFINPLRATIPGTLKSGKQSSRIWPCSSAARDFNLLLHATHLSTWFQSNKLISRQVVKPRWKVRLLNSIEASLKYEKWPAINVLMNVEGSLKLVLYYISGLMRWICSRLMLDSHVLSTVGISPLPLSIAPSIRSNHSEIMRGIYGVSSYISCQVFIPFTLHPSSPILEVTYSSLI